MKKKLFVGSHSPEKEEEKIKKWKNREHRGDDRQPPTLSSFLRCGIKKAGRPGTSKQCSPLSKASLIS
jgi:hypothetical protein